MEGTGQSSEAESRDESMSHFAGWAIASAPLVLGFDLTNATRMERAWPIISNERAMAVSQVQPAARARSCDTIRYESKRMIPQAKPTALTWYFWFFLFLVLVHQCWEADRPDPSGTALKMWQATTLPAVVVGCGAGCPCEDRNPNCSMWAHEKQCEENPGYMKSVCPKSCASSSQQTGWTVASSGQVKTPASDCLDSAGQLPAADAGLNWLRTAKCDDSKPSQRWSYTDGQLKSIDTGLCLGVMAHWLWPQPMVSLLPCGGHSTTNITIRDGVLTSGSGYGCYGVSDLQGPPSSLWRKPMPNGRTAVLAINGAALPQEITIDVAEVLKPDRDAGFAGAAAVSATDIWTGTSLGEVTHITRQVAPHGNIFIALG